MMEELKGPDIGISNLVETSNQFYLDLLGYAPERTFLQSIPENQWDNFAQTRGLNYNSGGVYLPRNQIAFIRDENPLSLFHEYFGHGLYCERTLSGMRLINLEKKLLEEEKQEFDGTGFTLEDVQRFRDQNQTFQQLREFGEQNLERYETFAIWTEYLLSNEFGLMKNFRKKYDSFPKQEKESVDSVINFSEKYGNLATFYASGLSKMTTPDRIEKLLGEIYGGETIKNSKLILLTGSKKPFSDIDLFASSYYLQPVKNDWLDLVVFDEKDFEKRIKLFETQVTHPIMSGEFVSGDKNYLLQKRIQLEEQPITEDAIKHNFQKAEEQKKSSENYPNDSEERRIGENYSQTYLKNGLALMNGKRLFTKEELTSYSPSGTNIQLKGGKENNAT